MRLEPLSKAAALHIAYWRFDPWYRWLWFVWPQALALLLAVGLFADHSGGMPRNPAGAEWAKPIDCSNASTPGCASSRRGLYSWEEDVSRPTVANQAIVIVDRAAFETSAAEDQQKLRAALGAYYRRDGAKALDSLKGANASDSNVMFLKALALLTSASTDQVQEARTLLRSLSATGHRHASSVLGRVLFSGIGGVAREEVAGRKLIDDGVAAGDPYAMRLAAAGHISREFGSPDSGKAVDLLRKAQEAGDPVALAQLAFAIHTGRGGLERDDEKVLAALRRAAKAGHLGAQITLGRVLTQRYVARENEDPSEGIEWYRHASEEGHSIFAIMETAWVHRFARATPWFDTRRSFELLQQCAQYRYLHCQYWLARAYQDGAGTARDLAEAYARHTVAKDLGRPESAAEITKLDGFLQSEAKAKAVQRAQAIGASLKPPPRVILLQTPETAAPSPWVSGIAGP